MDRIDRIDRMEAELEKTKMTNRLLDVEESGSGLENLKTHKVLPSHAQEESTLR